MGFRVRRWTAGVRLSERFCKALGVRRDDQLAGLLCSGVQRACSTRKAWVDLTRRLVDGASDAPAEMFVSEMLECAKGNDRSDTRRRAAFGSLLTFAFLKHVEVEDRVGEIRALGRVKLFRDHAALIEHACIGLRTENGLRALAVLTGTVPPPREDASAPPSDDGLDLDPASGHITWMGKPVTYETKRFITPNSREGSLLLSLKVNHRLPRGLMGRTLTVACSRLRRAFSRKDTILGRAQSLSLGPVLASARISERLAGSAPAY